MARTFINVVFIVAGISVILGTPSDSLGGGLTLTQTGSFHVSAPPGFSLGIAVDSGVVYQTNVYTQQIDTYSTGGSFLGTIPLLGGPATILGGFTGITVLDNGDFLLAAMYNDSRNSAMYRFTKDGTFVGEIPISPAVNNVTGIAFDGTSTYVTQNDWPLSMYKVNIGTGAIEQTFSSIHYNGHGQRLSLDYWRDGNVLFEGYDEGVSLIDPLTGLELQHFTTDYLGYGSQTQTFGVATEGDTLYLMTNGTIYTYSISGTIPSLPEPSSLIMGTFAVVAVLGLQRWNRA